MVLKSKFLVGSILVMFVLNSFFLLVSVLEFDEDIRIVILDLKGNIVVFSVE